MMADPDSPAAFLLNFLHCQKECHRGTETQRKAIGQMLVDSILLPESLCLCVSVAVVLDLEDP